MMTLVSVMTVLESSLKVGSGWYVKAFSSSSALSSCRTARSERLALQITAGDRNSTTLSFLLRDSCAN